MNKKANKTKPGQVLMVTAKCSDMCSLQLLELRGKSHVVISEGSGYVPKWLPNDKEEHYGDYIQLEIDMATGKILNWVPPTKAALAETFGK